MVSLAGTTQLVRLALRRDRLTLSVWIGAISLIAFGMTSVMISQYPTSVERIQAATLLAHNPAILIIRGAASSTSIGGLVVSEGIVIWGVLTALMTILAMIRHTRQNEETGRLELVGSAQVGRFASLSAALVVALGANILLATSISLILIAKGLPVEGSLAAGLGLGSIGISFAAISAVLVQLSENTRSVTSLSLASLGAAYLLRGIGDALGKINPDNATITSAWPAWLSPIGWAQQIKPFADNSWLVLILPLGLFVITTSLAFWLNSSRDVGSGLLPTPTGPSRASPSLLSTLGLAWRLQKGILIGWLTAMLVFGTAFGSVGKQISQLQDSQMAQLLARLAGSSADFSQVFFAAILTFFGAIATGYVVQALLVAGTEESDGRTEPVLAAAVARWKWLVSHIFWSIFGMVVILLAFGLAMGLTYGLIIGDVLGQLTTLLGAALVQIPASLTIAGAVVAVIGMAPVWAKAISWLVLAAALLVGPFGEFFNFSQNLRNLSPFSHTPALPMATLTLTPLIILLAITVVLTTIGIIIFQRRDLNFR